MNRRDLLFDTQGALGQGRMAKWLETLDHPENSTDRWADRQDELGSTGQWQKEHKMNTGRTGWLHVVRKSSQ